LRIERSPITKLGKYPWAVPEALCLAAPQWNPCKRASFRRKPAARAYDAMVPSKDAMVRGIGAMVRSMGAMVRGMGAMVPSMGAMVRSKGAMVRSMGAMVRSMGAMVPSKGAMVPSMGAMVRGMGAMVRAVGAAFVSPALQRGVGETSIQTESRRDGAHFTRHASRQQRNSI
jgi:hypothetical protein